MINRFHIPFVTAALLVHAATGPTAYAQLDEPPSAAPVWHGQPMDETIVPGESIAQRIPNSEERLRSAQAYIGQHPDTSYPIRGLTILNIGSNVQFLSGPIFETTTYWLRICNDLGCTDSNVFTITVEEEQAAPGAPAPFQNAAEAVRWYRLAAEQGDASAQDNPLAQELANLRALAEAGATEAQYSLGVKYDTGEGVPQDDAEAVRWYRLAAEQGHASQRMQLTRGAPPYLIESFFEGPRGRLFSSSKEAVETFEVSVFHQTEMMLK